MRFLVDKSMSPLRSLIDRAEENSVVTQPLMQSVPASASDNATCARSVASSRVSAATSTDVSR